MTGPSQRGGKGRRVLCTDYQEKRLAYEAAVLAKCNEDPTESVAYLKLHPFAKVAHKYGIATEDGLELGNHLIEHVQPPKADRLISQCVSVGCGSVKQRTCEFSGHARE